MKLIKLIGAAAKLVGQAVVRLARGKGIPKD